MTTPAKRSLVLVIAILAVAQVVSAKEPVVVVDPEWINYGQTTTITVTFDPPCPQVSIFRRGIDAGYPDQCVYGPKCPVDHARPKSVEASLNPAGTWLRFTGVNAMANGRYYATCPSNNATYEGSVMIGVKPRIIAVEFGNPSFGVQVNLTRWQGGKQVPWNSPQDDPKAETTFKVDRAIPLPQGESFLTVILGMGVDPHLEAPQATSPKLFTFEAPDFDDNSLEMPRERLGDYIPLADYPMVTRFRYRLTRNWLAYNKKCQLKSLAVATLNPETRDRATIQLDFEFDPTVANVTVKQIGPNEAAEVGHSCDCLFTCHVGSCPTAPAPSYDFEWSFPVLSQVSPKFDSQSSNRDLLQRQSKEQLQLNLTLSRQFVPGNVVGFPTQYLLNATACRELFNAARDLMRTQQPLTVTCRVAGGQVPANVRQVRFYDFMEKSFKDECKNFRRPESTGDARDE